MKNQSIWAGIIVIFFLLAPLVGNTFWLQLLIATLYLAYQSMSWSIIGGLAGQISLGNTIFIAVGAYTSTFMLINYDLSPWIGMLLGAVISVLIALFIGVLSFRFKLRGIFFAMVTLAFAEILKVTIENIEPLGGAYGMIVPIVPNSFLAFQFSSKISYYYIILGMLFLVVLVINWIKSHKIGSYLTSIRENEQAAEAIGINPMKYKLIAFMLSSFFAAFGGTFMAQYTLFIDPEMADWNFGLTILVAAIVGGIKHSYGPIVGAIILQPISEIILYIWGDALPGIDIIVYGLVLVIVILNMPNGLISGITKIFRKINNDTNHHRIKEGNI